MFGRLTRRFAGGRDDEFCECRRCGTAVERPGTPCPACGARDIASYEL
jgi:rubrerythrin